MLRRTAIVTEQWLHVFDVDAPTPKCSIYSPFTHSYKVKLQLDGKVKTIPVKGAAWSPLLGKDHLPQPLLHSKLYSRPGVVVLLKHAGTYQLCSPRHDIITAPGPSAPQLAKLGLVFAPVEYVKDSQPRQQGQQTRAKRGRPPGSGSSKSLLAMATGMHFGYKSWHQPTCCKSSASHAC